MEMDNITQTTIKGVIKHLPKALKEVNSLNFEFAFKAPDGYVFNMTAKTDYPINRATPKLERAGIKVEKAGEKGRRLITIPDAIFEQFLGYYAKGGAIGDFITAPEGYVFTTFGSHRARQSVERKGVPYVTLYSFSSGSNGSAGQTTVFLASKDFDKIKSVTGVGVAKTKLKGSMWFARDENENLRSVFRKAQEGVVKELEDSHDTSATALAKYQGLKSVKYATGGAVGGKDIVSHYFDTYDERLKAIADFIDRAEKYAHSFKVGGKKRLQKILGKDMFFNKGGDWFFNTKKLYSGSKDELVSMTSKIPKINDKFEDGGNVKYDDMESMRYHILNHASGSSFSRVTGVTDYKTIDKIRLYAIMALNRDGDMKYSIDGFNDLVRSAYEEVKEAEHEAKFASYGSGGEIGDDSITEIEKSKARNQKEQIKLNLK